MGLVSRGRYLFLWLAQGPAGQQRERDMTIEALTGAHAGTSDGDISAGDLYETARTFESLGVSEELTKALADQGIVSAFPIQASPLPMRPKAATSAATPDPQSTP